ncbi:hypothetical protein VTG60DRAFT_5216 [Thermothelomyces hinnuleus]
MRLLQAVRPVLARRGVVTRQLLGQPVVRSPVVLPKRYNSGAEYREPTDWKRAIEVNRFGLWIELPPYLEFSGQNVRRNNFPNIWLRDNCRCTDCINQDTKQRNFDTFKIPPDIRITKVKADYTHVWLEWSDGHRSVYRWDFLRHYMYYDYRADKPMREYWGDEIQMKPPEVDYDVVMDDDNDDHGVALLTDKIRTYGVCFVTHVPYEDPDDTRKLLERIAFIRQTHYGGFYDFKPDLAMADTAYTNQALPPHTDTTYFTDPAGLQAFHMLSHEPGPDGERPYGGASVLVDGFKAARVLHDEDREAYNVLKKVRLPWHASGNKGITIRPDVNYPVFETHSSLGLYRIRWNNDDRGVVPFDKVRPEVWYRAAAKWNEIINRPRLQYWFQLTPGTVVIFDNWRVLHGRNAFKGIRRICGAYINRDDWVSRWGNLNLSERENLYRVIG